jgi:hypothetical protein
MSPRVKAVWSIGLGLAGLVLLVFAVLALAFGVIAHRELAADGEPTSRADLGIALGVLGLITSTVVLILLL